MVDLHATSRIGFGAYRVSARSSEHAAALVHALRSGCNLIDTSSNYMDGQSEEVIGQVHRENLDLETFVVTKAGYIEGSTRAVVEKLYAQGLSRDAVVAVANGFDYSTHPDFLRHQIACSLHRLCRSRLDGFLLHNPEHLLDRSEAPAAKDEYYARIQAAFEFLEDMASAGTIRYYGISSNTFPLPTDQPRATDLRRVLAIAQKVATGNHFKLVQFPLNLLETDALKPNADGVSLVDLARACGLVTFANRPLNAKSAFGPVRLADYIDRVAPCDAASGDAVFDHCVDIVAKQLKSIGSTDTPMDFTVMQFLRDSWMRIGHPDLVQQIFTERLHPFLDRLYGGEITREDAAVFAELQWHATLHSLDHAAEKTEGVRRELESRGVIAPGDSRPLAVISCARGLESGVDHVLVGMRRPEYVDCVKALF